MRTLASLLIRLVFLAGLGLAGYFVVENYAPSRHLPWKDIDLTQPPGLATGVQVQRLASDFDQCLAALEQAGVDAVPAQALQEGEFCRVENAVRIRSGVTRVSPEGLVMSCPLAAAYVMWDQQVLQPAARDLMNSEIEAVTSYGSYACRRMYGDETQRPSEHATANAIDIAEFRFADGRRITVKDGWFADGPEAVFLRELRRGGCQVFGTVLSPDYNEAHADHLHFDMGNWSFCPIGPIQPPGVPPGLLPEPEADQAPANASKAKLAKVSV